MKLENAIRFWVDDSGYRQIQAEFSKRQHAGNIKYAASNLISNDYNIGRVNDAIETIRDAMVPSDKIEIYYRGDMLKLRKPHIREGFFAVTRDPKKAECYGECKENIYKVIVSKDVPRISFLAEGDETLLADGMVYEYSADNSTITVRTPTEANKLPYLGNLYKEQKNIKNARDKLLFERTLDKLYCYSFEEPDEDIGYIGDCDESVLSGFKDKLIEEKINILKIRLNILQNLDLYKDNIPFYVSQDIGKDSDYVISILKELLNLSIGGKRSKKLRQRRQTSRSKYYTRRKKFAKNKTLKHI